ncbi:MULTISPECIES: hypothetical protein [unclassified Streptomyces]|uniref:hypothetical protein n=1 Tax=unclassified Streptomyces TaxID=2593676 RepID=UPI0036E132EC
MAEQSTTTAVSTVQDTHEELVRHGFGPYFATPCGILAPLLDRLEAEPDYRVVTREDNAIGQAAGAALAGAAPVALMQNSEAYLADCRSPAFPRCVLSAPDLPPPPRIAAPLGRHARRFGAYAVAAADRRRSPMSS